MEVTFSETATTKQIREYCAKYGKDSREKDLDFSSFIVLEKYKLVYCSVPKVACTVWKRILANLEGIKINSSVHQETKGKLKLLSDYTTEDRVKILKTFKKFTFVRDPFERLLSAYKDAFGESSSEATKVGNIIARKLENFWPNVAVLISTLMLITQLSNNLQPI